MKCFVASALGHKDVDRIFDRVIKKALRRYHIQPLRVDRVEHNEDIDDKIFALLNAADFCIADLTYARPSVYYEAGYAFGGKKPVIYICREDHLEAKADDPLGNLKVHFDLQMKNIIPWRAPNSTLRRQLQRRIAVVLRPLLRNQDLQNRANKATEAFKRFSLHQQLTALTAKSASMLRSIGFAKVRHQEQHPYETADPFYVKCSRWRGRSFQKVRVTVRASFTKKEIYGGSIPDYLSEEESRRLSRQASYLFYVCLGTIRTTTLRARLPSFTPVSDRLFSRTMPESTYHVAEREHVVVIDGVKSIPDFTERLTRSMRSCGLTN